MTDNIPAADRMETRAVRGDMGDIDPGDMKKMLRQFRPVVDPPQQQHSQSFTFAVSQPNQRPDYVPLNQVAS